MIETIEILKQKLNEEKNNKGDWKSVYRELLQEIYKQPVLFFALSRSEFKKERKSSTPLISTKDFGGAPSLYVFSDIEFAASWMRYYKQVIEDIKYGLIGAVRKEENDFLQIFSIAKHMNVQYIMLDEGGAYVGISIDDFLEANQINIHSVQIQFSKEEMEQILENKKQPTLKFNEVFLIPLTRS